MDEKFGVVLVAGLTIFGLFLIYDQSTDGITTETPEEIVYYSEGFGTVGQADPDHRTVQLGDFNVGDGRADILGYQNRRVTIEDRLIRDQTHRFEYNATQPRGGTLEFEVLGRDGTGAVWFKVNGEKIFEEHLIGGSTPEIEIPEQELRNGVNNFELGVNRDGIFTSSQYALEDIELRVSDRKFSDHRDNFRVYGYEIEDFVEADLNFRIDESIRENPLEIKINDNEIYNREQARTEETVEISPDNLRTGSNSIEFSTSRPDSRYDIVDTDIVIRSLEAVEREKIEENFTMTTQQISYSERDDTTNYMNFEYRSLIPTTRSLEIQINNEEIETTPSSGTNQLELPNEVFQTQNELTIDSRGSYTLENFEIKSVKQQ